jgi:hypothetical protein
LRIVGSTGFGPLAEKKAIKGAGFVGICVTTLEMEATGELHHI